MDKTTEQKHKAKWIVKRKVETQEQLKSVGLSSDKFSPNRDETKYLAELQEGEDILNQFFGPFSNNQKMLLEVFIRDPFKSLLHMYQYEKKIADDLTYEAEYSRTRCDELLRERDRLKAPVYN